jgi:hypothetical protein
MRPGRGKILTGAVLALVLAGAGAWAGVRTLQRVGHFQGYAPEQPIAYSHKLHAGEYRIECLYCHFGAEKSRHAGIPPLNVCMNCHRQLDKQSRELVKLKEAYAQNRPIRWVKIHNLPDFVYFSHRQHMAPGARGNLVCQDCHGPVETMERMRQYAPLTMGWCLDCHQQKGITEFSELSDTVRDTLRGPSASEEAQEPPWPVGGMDCAKCHY